MANCAVCGGKIGALGVKRIIKDGCACQKCIIKCGLLSEPSLKACVKSSLEYTVADFKVMLTENTMKANHISGLPIVEGKACILTFQQSGLLFSVGDSEQTFDLSYDRILNLDIKTDVEIQKHIVSSVGGAVGGAVLFGSLGAMIGGRAKEKVTKEIDYYFIISYTKDNELEYITFDLHEETSGVLMVKRTKLEALIERFKPLCSTPKGNTSL